jgi:hypothetical protein
LQNKHQLEQQRKQQAAEAQRQNEAPQVKPAGAVASSLLDTYA